MDGNIYSLRRDKTYSVKIFSPIGYDEGADVVIPEKYMGVPVTEMVFVNKINSDFKSIRISANINSIIFPQSRFIYDVRIFAGTLTVDENNRFYKAEGGGLYSKDGKILYFVFERYTESFVLPQGTERIEKGAFSYLSGLKSVTLTPGLRSIGAHCFAYCPLLEEPELPEGLEEIDEYAFCCCTKISSLKIPDSVRVIGKGAFFQMDLLNEIRLPDKLNKIDEEMFKRCLKLHTVNIPAGVSHIAENAFDVCTKEITVDPNNGTFGSEGGSLFNKSKTELIRASLTEKKYEVPDKIRTIHKRAFAHNQYIEEVVLPESCAEIQAGAFYECARLRKINLENVTELGAKAFYNCTWLNSIELNCETIGTDAFYYCRGLKKAVLREGVHTIKSGAFFYCPIEELIIPKQTRILEDDSLDFGKTLVIYDSVPFSEKAVLTTNLTIEPEKKIIIKSADTDEVLHTVWIGFANPVFQGRTLECFGTNWNFDYNCFDNFFKMINITGVSVLGSPGSGKYADPVYAAAYRLEYSPDIPNEKREWYLKWFRNTGIHIIKDCIDNDSFKLLELSEKYGAVNEDNITAALEYSASKGAVEFTSHLLDYRAKHIGELPDDLELK